ncbi:TPA: hypothetical protein RQN91_005518 [Klebsiella michiganensis]|nr:hypothetical protein [Klebsiella michiganensis]
MNQKPRLTPRQALKMALKDVGGVILYGLLFAAGTGIILGAGWAGKTLLETYYPKLAQMMAMTTCVMVVVLVVASEVLIRARNLSGDDMPRRQQQCMDAAILVILVVQIATTCALAWMIYHSALISHGFMVPVMVVCAFVVAASAFGRLSTGWSGW